MGDGALRAAPAAATWLVILLLPLLLAPAGALYYEEFGREDSTGGGHGLNSASSHELELESLRELQAVPHGHVTVRHGLPKKDKQPDAMLNIMTVNGHNHSLRELTEVPGAKANMTLCVPCVDSDLDALMEKLVPSVEKQTLAPLEIIVVLSGFHETFAQDLRSMLQGHLNLATVRVLSTAERQLPGASRNRCAREARGRYVSFFDADDRMHPLRLEVLNYVASKYRPKSIVHGYSHEGLRQLPQLYDVWTTDTKVFFANQTVEKQPNYESAYAHRHSKASGWITIDRKVIDDVQQAEDRKSGEDLLFELMIRRQYDYAADAWVYVGLPLGDYSNGECIHGTCEGAMLMY